MHMATVEESCTCMVRYCVAPVSFGCEVVMAHAPSEDDLTELVRVVKRWPPRVESATMHTRELHALERWRRARAPRAYEVFRTIALPFENALPPRQYAGLVACAMMAGACVATADADQGLREPYGPDESVPHIDFAMERAAADWPDGELLKLPAAFGDDEPSLAALLPDVEAAYRRDLPERLVTKPLAHWAALFGSVERARERARRRAVMLPLLLCRRKYYDAHAGDVDGADIVVKLARPGIDGVFFHMASYL